jgi:putative ABC transport system permease protein
MVVTAMLQNAFQPEGVEANSHRFLQVTGIRFKSADGNSSWMGNLGYKIIDAYLRPMPGVELVAAVSSPHTVSVYQANRITELQRRYTDANYWQVMEFELLAGRQIDSDDVEQGRFVAVLGENAAKKLFPAESALGKKLSVAGQQFEVIGLVRDALQLNVYSDMWVPVTTQLSSEYKNQLMGAYSAILLAKREADLPLIQAEVARIATTVKHDDPQQFSRTYMWADSKLDYFARQLLMTSDEANSGAALLLLIIALCMLLFMLLPALNLINLNAGRMMERSTEIGVRKAFGATSLQLVKQFVVENILLCLVGGVLGLLLAKLVLMWLGATSFLPNFEVQMNLRVFAYGMLITVVFGVLSGVVPAWKMSRLDPVSALKGVH